MQDFSCPRMQDVITKLADRFGYDLATFDGEFSVRVDEPDARDLVVEVRSQRAQRALWNAVRCELGSYAAPPAPDAASVSVGYWEGWEDPEPDTIEFSVTPQGWLLSAPVDKADFVHRQVGELVAEIDERFLSNPRAYLAFQRVGDVSYDVDRAS